MQYAIPQAACIGANRASILAQGRLGSGSEVVSPGSWPSTLAVGGALSLKAVAGLRVLVNAASAFVCRNHSTRDESRQVGNWVYS